MSEHERGTSAVHPLSLGLSDPVETKGTQGDELDQRHRNQYRGVSYETKCLWRARLYFKGAGPAVTNCGVGPTLIDVNLHPFARSLADKLHVLREAVVRDQQSCVQPSACHERETRRAAAAAAFSSEYWPLTTAPTC